MARGTELDVLVIGGGVVGAGCALDAATRGLSVGLVEPRDFASGTSSRSSKLIHGGLRYLEMLDFGLVREALAGARAAPQTRSRRTWSGRCRSSTRCTHRVLGARLRRRGRRALRRAWRARPRARPAAPPHLTAATAPAGRARRCARTRWSARSSTTTPRSTTRGTPWSLARTAAPYGAHVRHPRPRRRLPARGRAGRRRARRVTSRPATSSTCAARQVVNATGVWTDDIQALAGERGQFHVRAVQGHPPGRAARPDPLRHRPDPAHREERALRDPVGPALDHRHHRHRLGCSTRPTRPRASRHRLPARARQHACCARRSAATTSRASTPACGRCCAGESEATSSSPASTPWRSPVPG